MERELEASSSDKDLAQKLRDFLCWTKGNVPFFGPQISLDIIIWLMTEGRDLRHSNLKNLHLAIGYSQDRTREVLRHLEMGGWVRIENSQRDGRSKHLVPTEKLDQLVQQIILQVAELGTPQSNRRAANGHMNDTQMVEHIPPAGDGSKLVHE